MSWAIFGSKVPKHIQFIIDPNSAWKFSGWFRVIVQYFEKSVLGIGRKPTEIFQAKSRIGKSILKNN